jgi:hypothetical protein
VSTPIRVALVAASHLHPHVLDGLRAVSKVDKRLIDEAIRSFFLDSIDFDAAVRSQNPGANRWDYLLGLGEPGLVVGLEPHSASTSEVSVVIAKRRAALDQLRPHLNTGTRIAEWFWVASGRVDFVPHDKVVLQLQQAGITFVGGTLRARHLPRR